jgi:hypothetical protein
MCYPLHPKKDNAPQNLGKTITMKRKGKNTLLFFILVALSFLQTQLTHMFKNKQKHKNSKSFGL